MSRSGLIVAASLTIALACCPKRVEPTRDPASMQKLASQLGYLTSAVEAAILDGKLKDDASDADVIRLATAHDLSLAKPFETYKVRVSRAGHDAVLLVCTADGEVRLLEDATCTERADRHHWKEANPGACEFTTPVSAACPAR
jgi:hypothetical protein